MFALQVSQSRCLADHNLIQTHVQFCVCLGCAVTAAFWRRDIAPSMWYVWPVVSLQTVPVLGVLSYFTYLVRCLSFRPSAVITARTDDKRLDSVQRDDSDFALH
jgi:hypothetical protein